MKTKSYFRYITIFFISTQFIFSGLNEAASNDVFLTEDQKTDEEVCQFAEFSKAFAAELDRRKLDCEILSTVTSATQSDTSQVSDEVDTFRDKLKRCWDFKSTHKIEVLVEFNKAGQVLDVWFDTIRAENDEDFKLAVREVERAFFDCGPFPSFVRNIHSDNLEGILLSFNPTLSLFPQDTIKPINNISIREYADNQICRLSYNKLFLFEAKRRGLTCDVDEGLTAQVTALSTTSTELLAAQQKAEALKQQLAELQSQQSQPQQATSADTQIPLITITRADTDDKKGIIAGRVSDNVGVAEVTVDGITVPLMSDGSFEYSTYVPATGLSVVVEVTDLAGLSSSQTVTLERNVNLATASISFDRLNPISKPAKKKQQCPSPYHWCV